MSRSYHRQLSPRSYVKHLLMKLLRIQLVQALKLEDLTVWYKFCHAILAWTLNGGDLPARFTFSDQATFHINGKVNRHNVHVWGAEDPLSMKEITKSECVLCCFRGEGFFFMKNTVMSNSYLDILTL